MFRCRITARSKLPSHNNAMPRTKQFEIALSTFEKIRAAFPTLTMNLVLDHPHLDLAMDIPAQPGLTFKMDLNVQNLDELHLSASALWYEWFPCTNSKKVERYLEAVSGLLSGEFRILEHWRGKRPVKAQLQRPCRGRWENVATWLDVSAIVPWPRKSHKVAQNKPSVRPLHDLESLGAD
jgi:hypothetical protein